MECAHGPEARTGRCVVGVMEGDDTASRDVRGWLLDQRSASVDRGPGQRAPRHRRHLARCRVAQPARDTGRVDNVVRPRDADGQLAGGGADGSTGGGSYRAYSPVVCWWRWGVGCSSRSWLHELVGAGRLSVTRVAVGRAVLLTVGGAVGRIAGARAMVAVTGVSASFDLLQKAGLRCYR